MKKSLPLFLIVLTLFSCHRVSPLQKEGNSVSDSLTSLTREINKTEQPFQDSDQTILLSNINSTMDTLVFKKSRQSLYFVLKITKGKSMTISAIPTKDTGNLRISQITDPDGNGDGPFGQKVNYPIKELGNYTVRVSESLMEGTPFEGWINFKVTVNQK